MLIDYNSYSKLEDIQFKYERLGSLLSCLQSVVSEMVDVIGLPEHVLEYSLYELEMEIDRNNKEFGKIIHGAKFVKEAVS